MNSRDASLLKSLAIAFGDGLAFGVGMKLAQPATRSAAAPRIDRPQTAAPSMDAIVNALEARLQEQSASLDQRLAGIEAKMAADSKTLHEQDYGIARRAEENLVALRDEVVAIQREFAEAVGRIVAQHVEAQVAEPVSALDQRVSDSLAVLRSEIAAMQHEFAASIAAHVQRRVEDEVQRQVATAVNAAVQQAIQQQLAPVRAESAELRQRMAETDTNVFEFVLAMGQACRELESRAATAAPPPAPAPEAAAPESPETPLAAAPESEDVPGFSQLSKGSGLWRVPMVSSMILAVGALVVSRYL